MTSSSLGSPGASRCKTDLCVVTVWDWCGVVVESVHIYKERKCTYVFLYCVCTELVYDKDLDFSGLLNIYHFFDSNSLASQDGALFWLLTTRRRYSLSFYYPTRPLFQGKARPKNKSTPLSRQLVQFCNYLVEVLLATYTHTSDPRFQAEPTRYHSGRTPHQS